MAFILSCVALIDVWIEKSKRLATCNYTTTVLFTSTLKSITCKFIATWAFTIEVAVSIHTAVTTVTVLQFTLINICSAKDNYISMSTLICNNNYSVSIVG